MILLIDNYDSFSYNLYQMIGAIAQGESQPGAAGDGSESSRPSRSNQRTETADTGIDPGTAGDGQETTEQITARPSLMVIRNDAMSVEEIEALHPDGIILSPGPGRPEDAGVCIEVVEKLGPKIPILGVCLGHQSICKAYGAVVSYAKELMHGKQSDADVDTDSIVFAGCATRIKVGRYHSLAAVEDTMPDCLQVIARTDDGEIMAVKHKEYEVYGLQFHPESILTPDGERMLRNWFESTQQGKQAE